MHLDEFLMENWDDDWYRAGIDIKSFFLQFSVLLKSKVGTGRGRSSRLRGTHAHAINVHIERANVCEYVIVAAAGPLRRVENYGVYVEGFAGYARSFPDIAASDRSKSCQ